MDKYQEQFARIKRFQDRVREIVQGTKHDKPTQYHTDMIYSFFQNCYHLKDWIKNDMACAGWDDVEAFVKGERDLTICADLCNSTKHLKLTKPRSAVNPKIKQGTIHLNITDVLGGPTTVEIAVDYSVETIQGDEDAYLLAKRCCDLWEEFILKNGGTLFT